MPAPRFAYVASRLVQVHSTLVRNHPACDSIDAFGAETQTQVSMSFSAWQLERGLRHAGRWSAIHQDGFDMHKAGTGFTGSRAGLTTERPRFVENQICPCNLQQPIVPFHALSSPQAVSQPEFEDLRRSGCHSSSCCVSPAPDLRLQSSQPFLSSAIPNIGSRSGGHRRRRAHGLRRGRPAPGNSGHSTQLNPGETVHIPRADRLNCVGSPAAGRHRIKAIWCPKLHRSIGSSAIGEPH